MAEVPERRFRHLRPEPNLSYGIRQEETSLQHNGGILPRPEIQVASNLFAIYNFQ